MKNSCILQVKKFSETGGLFFFLYIFVNLPNIWFNMRQLECPIRLCCLLQCYVIEVYEERPHTDT